MIHDCVGRTLFAFGGEDGTCYTWANLQRVIKFTERWLTKVETGNEQFPYYDPLLTESNDGRPPRMHTFDQFVANLGTNKDEYSVECEFILLILAPH